MQCSAFGVRRSLRKCGYLPDKQEKATVTVLEQAEQICARGGRRETPRSRGRIEVWRGRWKLNQPNSLADQYGKCRVECRFFTSEEEAQTHAAQLENPVIKRFDWDAPPAPNEHRPHRAVMTDVPVVGGGSPADAE